jgi:hypothetical protein
MGDEMNIHIKETADKAGITENNLSDGSGA